MKFLVDESIEYRVVLHLKEKGFDTASVASDYPGLKDKRVLSKAKKEGRILVTNDKDFGESIFRQKLPHKGVILLRLPDETAQAKIKKLNFLLKNYGDKLKDNFVVVTKEKVRIRKPQS